VFITTFRADPCGL